MILRAALVAAVLALGVVASAPVQAQVQRFSVIIGNNDGAGGEVALRYAERDASRFHTVLRDLGNVPAENTVILLGESADASRRAIIQVNDRIRRLGDAETTLVVYYSGHGDAETLHLGTSTMPIDELRQLVSGSAADFRMLVVDSCRSGGLTRRKGGRTVRAFNIALDPGLSGEGAVYLTSSSASEDSQESDELQGSIFTHHLVSGLLGAADANRDGRVDLTEAYRYSYQNTLRSSSRTLAGLQHPTFRHDIGGQGDFVLTVPGQTDPRRGLIGFPPGHAYLITQERAGGSVIGEVGVYDSVRRMSLRAGSYFIVARASDHLLEGTMVVAPGGESDVDLSTFERVEYARLVRRGGTDLTRTVGVTAGYRMRTPVIDGASLCQGAVLGGVLDFAELGLRARAAGCRGEFTNETLRANTDELSLTLGASRAWDFGDLSIEVGIDLGGAALRESFETRGRAPTRWSAAGLVGPALGLSWQLPAGYSMFLETSAQTYFFRVEDTDRVESWTARFAWPSSAGLAKRW